MTKAMRKDDEEESNQKIQTVKQNKESNTEEGKQKNNEGNT